MGSKKRSRQEREYLYLVRHAKAGERKGWNGDDRLRPLSKRGHKQAKRLVAAVGSYPVARLLTSPYVRCRQTLEPLAKNRGLNIEELSELEEHIPVEGALKLLMKLAGSDVMLCSHGDIIPALLDRLREEGTEVPDNTDTKKGSTWIIESERGRLLRASYLPPPA